MRSFESKPDPSVVLYDGVLSSKFMNEGMEQAGLINRRLVVSHACDSLVDFSGRGEFVDDGKQLWEAKKEDIRSVRCDARFVYK